MARVPFIDPEQRPELAPLAQRISGARRGRVINVYRALLNSPPLAETWFEHLNAVRWKTSLPGRLREIVIIRIGHLAHVAYIIKQHVPKLYPVPEADAFRFGCNAVVVGKKVVTNSDCPGLHDILKKAGYTPISVELDEFLKAGGSAKCLTLRVDGEEAAVWE